MILWLNGAFGAGKSQTAYELQRRLPKAFVYDPERAGSFMLRNIPKEIALSDFQDYPLWRGFNLDMLRYIAARYDGVLIVPMTLINPDYEAALIGALRAEGIEGRHFMLAARRETLVKRLHSRFEGKSSWAVKQIDRCLQAFEKDIQAEVVQTDDMRIEQVVEAVARNAGLALLPDRRNPLKRRIDRRLTQISMIHK